MFKDTDKELQRLEAELLAEEEVQQPQAVPEEEPDEELLSEEELDALLADTGPAKGRVVYQNFSNGYGRELRNYASGYNAYNSDTCDEDLDSYSEEVRQEPKKYTALVVLACLLAAGIVGILLWWLLRYGGLL